MERYQYQAMPQPVLGAAVTRPMYRDKRPANIHFDRRVVRGNTYAAAISTLNQLQAQAAAQAAATAFAKTRRRPQSKQQALPKQEQFAASATAPVLSNGASAAAAAAQTDDYLESLVDQVQERDMGLQTDEVEEDKPLPVMFVPKHAGVDRFTTIEAGELFDYHAAVGPVLEVLIGKSLDQGLVEVQEEEELKNLDARTKRFERDRDAMLAESQKLEQANLRRHQEKERRLEQDRQRRTAEAAVQRKLDARAVASQYLAGLQESVFTRLEQGGAFYDPTERAVRTSFMPWLSQAVAARMAARAGAVGTVDAVLADAIDIVVQEKAELLRKERERRTAEQAAREARARAEAEAEAARRREAEEQARMIEEAERMQREADAAEEAALAAEQAGEGGEDVDAAGEPEVFDGDAGYGDEEQ